MRKINKIGKFKRIWYQIRLSLMPQNRRSSYLKKKNIFFHFGDGTRYVTKKIPTEAYLVSIGNYCRIAANVDFITHDIIDGMFGQDPTINNEKSKYRFYMDKIVVGDYVMIGASSIILYGVKIGSHSIVAAGSVVTKDVPDGSIVGGNPARIIGNYYELAEKRSSRTMPTNNDSIEEIIKAFWEL